MDEFWQTVIVQAPNVLVAMVVLYWMSRTIERLLAVQERLIDTLISVRAQEKAPTGQEETD